MNKYRWLVALIVLALASLACQTVMGGGIEIPQAPQLPTNDNGGNGNDTTDPMPTEAPPVDNAGGGTQNSGEFPMPADATNVVTAQDTLIFETSLSVDEVVAFYRDEFGKQGLTERDSMTVTMGQLFTLVFDGDPSGKAISVSGVDMGDGTTTVTLVKQDF